MSKVVLFSNIKGGVGKTTLCAHFSEYLNESCIVFEYQGWCW